MSAPYSSLTAADYLDAAQALLPSGPAWPRDPNTNFAKYMSAIAGVAWLAHQALSDLFATELDPGAANWLLADWEKAYGITAHGSKDSRRAVLKAVIADAGGFTLNHYIALAASVGVEVNPDTPDIVITGPFTWEIHALASTSKAARKTFESAINSHNRASCVVTFHYDR
jgi:uncharacterized protein YmfQ (DUF2313 family)